jgi:uncharacterized membrane protein YgdD (TMEM256/DUF423 family)
MGRRGTLETAQEAPMTFHSRLLLCIAALSLLGATLAGAVASHALDEAVVRAFSTAVEFHFFHGLGLVAVTLAADRYRLGRIAQLAAWLLVAGIVLFCGAIYATTFGAPDRVGALTPLGGIAFMAGWVAFAVAIALAPADTR